MKNNTSRKTIHVDKPNLIPLWTLKQEDDVILKLSLFKEATPFSVVGQTVKLGAKTLKGLKEQIDGFTIKENELDIALKNSILVPGLVEIDLEFKDVGGKMTSTSFFINVNSKVLNDVAIKATNEFDTFTKTVKEITTDYQGLRKIVIDENNAANLQDQLNKTNSSLEQNKNELSARIDSFTKLAEGSTTGDAELIDGRVGANGVTYNNIGTAIRKQFDGTETKLFKFDNIRGNYFNKEKYTVVNLYNSNNLFTENTTAWALLIPIVGGKTYTIRRGDTSRNRNNIIRLSEVPKNGSSYLQAKYNSTTDKDFVVKTDVEDKYIYLWLYYGSITNEIITDIVNNLYIQEGTEIGELLPYEYKLIGMNALSNDVKAKLGYSVLYGKKGVIFGDSFTAGVNRYHSYIAQRTGATLLNYGLAGSAITPTTDQYTNNFLERIPSLPTDTDIKFVLVWGGINDSWVLSTNRRQLGAIDDVYSNENITLYGSIKKMCEDLIIKYPNIPIIALLPPNIIDNNQSYAHARNINTIAEALKNVYNKYGIPYLDMRSESGISTLPVHKELYNNKSSSTDDGYDMHWNNTAHEKISYTIQKFIENHLSN